MNYYDDTDTLGTIEDQITTDEAMEFGISIQSAEEIERVDD